MAFLRGRLPLDLHRRLAPVLFRSKPPGGELPAEGFRALPLRRALAGLSEEDRELFLRRYYYNQTAEQIAQEKHMNANTVRSRLARGRQALKAELQKGAIQIEDLCAESV